MRTRGNRATPLCCCCLSHFWWYAFGWDLACRSRIATCWFGVRLTSPDSLHLLLDASEIIWNERLFVWRFLFNQRPEKMCFCKCPRTCGQSLDFTWVIFSMLVLFIPHTFFFLNTYLCKFFFFTKSLWQKTYNFSPTNFQVLMSLKSPVSYCSHQMFSHISMVGKTLKIFIFFQDKRFSLMKRSHRNLQHSSKCPLFSLITPVHKIWLVFIHPLGPITKHRHKPWAL